jgi:hypothetical protein
MIKCLCLSAVLLAITEPAREKARYGEDDSKILIRLTFVKGRDGVELSDDAEVQIAWSTPLQHKTHQVVATIIAVVRYKTLGIRDWTPASEIIRDWRSQVLSSRPLRPGFLFLQERTANPVE